jgi:hypothetical protein
VRDRTGYVLGNFGIARAACALGGRVEAESGPYCMRYSLARVVQYMQLSPLRLRNKMHWPRMLHKVGTGRPHERLV